MAVINHEVQVAKGLPATIYETNTYIRGWVGVRQLRGIETIFNYETGTGVIDTTGAIKLWMSHRKNPLSDYKVYKGDTIRLLDDYENQHGGEFETQIVVFPNDY